MTIRLAESGLARIGEAIVAAGYPHVAVVVDPFIRQPNGVEVFVCCCKPGWQEIYCSALVQNSEVDRFDELSNDMARDIVAQVELAWSQRAPDVHRARWVADKRNWSGVYSQLWLSETAAAGSQG